MQPGGVQSQNVGDGGGVVGAGKLKRAWNWTKSNIIDQIKD